MRHFCIRTEVEVNARNAEEAIGWVKCVRCGPGNSPLKITGVEEVEEPEIPGLTIEQGEDGCLTVNLLRSEDQKVKKLLVSFLAKSISKDIGHSTLRESAYVLPGRRIGVMYVTHGGQHKCVFVQNDNGNSVIIPCEKMPGGYCSVCGGHQ